MDRLRHLQAERRWHVEAVAAIDAVLRQIHDTLGAAPSMAAAQAISFPISAAAGPERRGRRRFELTAEQSILEFLRRNGAPSTADINRFWREEGRRGCANVTILRLLRQNKIRRLADPNVRGSRYVLADTPQPTGRGDSTPHPTLRIAADFSQQPHRSAQA